VNYADLRPREDHILIVDWQSQLLHKAIIKIEHAAMIGVQLSSDQYRNLIEAVNFIRVVADEFDQK